MQGCLLGKPTPGQYRFKGYPAGENSHRLARLAAKKGRKNLYYWISKANLALSKSAKSIGLSATSSPRLPALT